MKAFLASILTVIAMGVLGHRVRCAQPAHGCGRCVSSARPMLASERVGVVDDGTGLYNYPNNGIVRYASQRRHRSAVAYGTYAPAPRRADDAHGGVDTSQVERAAGRDWKKTALVIGGTTATGAGLGAIFAGKKGALIGAAIGGGASTIYEARKR